VLSVARRLRWHVHEGRVRLERLEHASEAFLTSSVAGVRPLVRFRGRPVGAGRPGPLTRRIAVEVARLRIEGAESPSGAPPGAER
jgi:branched-subunit amino acid aminotransferase/4-amino-4-deoxychorismate lyase